MCTKIDYLSKMEDVNIPWGYHTMVKKLSILDGHFFIGKFVRKCDGLVSWHIHNTKTNKAINSVNGCVVMYNKEDDNDDNARLALNSLIKIVCDVFCVFEEELI